MLIIRGVNLFHTQVETLLNEFPELSAHYLLVVTREASMDEVEVKVELEARVCRELELDHAADTVLTNERINIVYRSLQKKIKDHIGLTMKLSFMLPGTIPRSEGGKQSRISDLRKK